MAAVDISGTCTDAINSLQQVLSAQITTFNSLNAACSTACDPSQSNVACTAECSTGLKDLETACHDAAAHVYQQLFRTTCSGAGAGARMTYSYQCLPSACSAADIGDIASQLNASSCGDALQVPWVTSCAVSLAQDDAYGNSGTGAMIAGIIGGILGTALLLYITWFLCRHYRSGRGFGAEGNEHLPMLGGGGGGAGRKFGPGSGGGPAGSLAFSGGGAGAGAGQAAHTAGFNSGGASGFAGSSAGIVSPQQSNYQRRLQVYKGGPPPGQTAAGSGAGASAAAPAGIVGTPLQPLRANPASASPAVSALAAAGGETGSISVAVAAAAASGPTAAALASTTAAGSGAMPVPVTPYIEPGSDAYPLPDASFADTDGASEAGSSVALGLGTGTNGQGQGVSRFNRGPGRVSGSAASPSAGSGAAAGVVPPAVRPGVTKLNATHGGLGKSLKPSEYRQLATAAAAGGGAGVGVGSSGSGSGSSTAAGGGGGGGSDLDALAKLGTTIKARIGLPTSPSPGSGAAVAASIAGEDGGQGASLRASLIADHRL